MTAAAGLLGYLAADFDPARIEAAQQRAPWRGTSTSAVIGRIGGIVALGNARAGCHRHVGVAIHGRIDNLPEVAQELGVDPDNLIAVLGEAYLRYGDDFARRLLGDFALLVLDERRGVLLGTRDWIGARPLFWGEHTGVVAFGSEVKQVLAALGLPLRIDYDALHAYESDATPAVDATFALGIHAVLPNGQVLASSAGGVRGWAIPVRFEPVHDDADVAAARVQELLARAVRRRTAGAVRIAAFVSGGMDSTSVAAMAALLSRTESGPPVIAGLTVTFPTVPESDESIFARQVAERAGIPWVPVAVEPVCLRELLADYIDLHDGPTFPNIGSNFAVARAAELGADVLLSGQLGDHWLNQGGYELELALLRGEWGAALRYLVVRLRESPRRAAGALLRGARHRLEHRRVEERFEASSRGYWTRLAMEVEERRAMRHGVQVAIPFGDQELARYLSGLSPTLKSSGAKSKAVLRAAMEDLLPRAVLERVGKTYFGPVHAAAFDVATESGVSPRPEVLKRYADAFRQLHSDHGIFE